MKSSPPAKFILTTNFYSIVTDMSTIKNLPLGVITCLSTNMNKLTSATGIYNSNSLLRSLLMKRMEVQLTLIKPSPGLSCGRITRNQHSGRVSGRLQVTGVKMAYRKLLFQLFRSSERKSAHSWLGKLLICFPNIENIASQWKLVVIFLSERWPACAGVTSLSVESLWSLPLLPSLLFFFAACKFRENRFRVGDDT